MYKADLLLYKNIEYILVWNKDRLQIYGDRALDTLQAIKNLYSQISIVSSTSQGAFYVVTARQFIYYNPIITKRMDIVWQKAATESLQQPITQINQNLSGDTLILLSNNGIAGYKINKKYESDYVKQVEFVKTWNIRTKQNISKISLSSDDKYIALNSSFSRVLIWHLQKIPELFNKQLNIEEFADINFSIILEQKIIDIQFRSNQHVSDGQPNSLYVVTNEQVKIYQEVLWDSAKINFVELFSIEMPGITNFVQIDIHREEHSAAHDNGQYFYNNNLQSLNTVCIQKERSFEIFQLYGLRQNKLDGSFQPVKKLNVPELSTISRIDYNSHKKTMTILGLADNNVCRILYNYKQDEKMQSHIINYESKIIEAIYDKDSRNLIIRKQDGLYMNPINQEKWLKPDNQIRKQLIYAGINIKSKIIYVKDKIYFVQNGQFKVFNLMTRALEKSLPFDKNPVAFFLIITIENIIFMYIDGQLVSFDSQSLKVHKKLTPPGKILKVEYNSNNKSLLLKYLKYYMLYKINVNEETREFNLVQIRKSMRHMIYGQGYWVEIYQNEVIFGRQNNKVATFSILNFLGAISKQHNVNVLYYRISHIYDQVFSLQIQNYIFFLNIFFDKKKQKFQVSVLKKNINSNQYLSIRLSKRSNPQSLQIIFVDNLIIKTESKILFYGRYLNEIINRSPFGLTQTLAYNFNAVKRIVPMHHPNFMQQQFLLANFLQAETIFEILYNKLLKYNKIQSNFELSFSTFLSMFNMDKYDEATVISKSIDQINYVPKDKIFVMKQLEKIILDDTGKINLSKNNPLILTSSIQFSIFRIENSRSLDFFSSIFISQTKNLWGIKNKTISTKQLCWILNSNNKQEAFNLLVQEPLQKKQQSLSWRVLKQYCSVIWYQNLNHIKKWVERIALAQYKKTQDPFDCLLWYILLGKKNILLALFKKCTDQVKTFEFLSRDFNQQNHKTAASKNAYALLSKKRYEHAIAFFILAGAHKDAITICLNQLQDIQLAILLCKLLQNETGKKSLEQIYRRNFLQTSMITNDIWIRHIGHYLLAEYVQSYNCLFVDSFDENRISYETNYKICCQTWKNDFVPELSVFHPSVIIFADKLKDSFRVKRELQQYQEARLKSENESNDIFSNFYEEKKPQQKIIMQEKSLKPNTKALLLNSIQYYLKTNMPYMAVIFICRHQQQFRDQAKILKRVWKKYVDKLFAITLQCKDMKFAVSKLRQLAQLKTEQNKVLFAKQETLRKYFENKLNSVDSGELFLDYYIQICDQQKILKFCGELVRESYRFSLFKHTAFKVETNQAYLVLIHFIMWTQNTLLRLNKYLEEKQKRYKEIQEQKYKIHVYLNLMKLVLLARFWVYDRMHTVLQQLNLLFSNTSQVQVDILTQQYLERMIEKFPTRRDNYETSKTSKKMDMLEQVFKKATQEEKQYLVVPRQSELIAWVINLVIFEQLEEKNRLQFGVKDLIQQEKEYYRTKVQHLIDKPKLEAIIHQIKEVIKNGSFAWAKCEYLNSNTHLEKQQILVVLKQFPTERYLENKLQTWKMEKVRDNPDSNSKQLREIKQNIFINGIEIFKNKSQAIKTFVFNNHEGHHNEFAVVFKRSIKKFDIFQNLIKRNRSQDGVTLLDQDSNINLANEVPPQYKLQSKAPIVNSCLNLLVYSNTKNQMLKSSKVKEIHIGSYLRSLDPLPPVQNELNCAVSHRYLPIFTVGAKGGIDIYNFSNAKNFHKIYTQALTDITKLKFNLSNQIIGGIDNEASFGAYRFDSTYSSNCVFALKKANITDFTFLNSNLIATCSQKDNLIQIYDPLASPSKNCVFKDSISNVSSLDYSWDSNKIIAARKNQINIYELRKGCVARFDTLNEIKCISLSKSSNRIIIGNAQGQVKIYTLEGEEIATIKAFKGVKKTPSVLDIRVCRQNIFALSSEGTISYVYNCD